MEKRISASNIMRVVSILGIICLLALQYVWWGNAYRAVEMEFLKNTQECLKKATDKAIIDQLDTKKKGIKFSNVKAMPKLGKKAKIYPQHTASTSMEMEFVVEEVLNLTNRPITVQLIDKQFCSNLNEDLGFVPKHSIKIVRLTNEIDSLSKIRYNRIAIGSRQDTIYHQIGFKAYTIVLVPSPIELYLKKGAFILVISIVLVLLVGAILILQFLNMERDRKFADFLIDYTRMMTHDLRTPVGSIQMIFKLFQKNQTTDPEIKEKYLAEGVNLTNKILLNLDNILYMAKSEQRELTLNYKEVNISDFMEETLKMYRERDYNPKIVTIETRYEPTPFSCKMDTTLMENVVCNLMDNAIKFTGMEAKITVTCKLENDVVELRFRDNGMGMTEGDQKRIFEIFERGSSNSNKHFPGFGIGLHFVQRVVKAHGGKISVQSEVGQGSEFCIRFFS
jgi:two-component system, OmpR family, phosphate regulon sensor histidine kinase PhoR